MQVTKTTKPSVVVDTNILISAFIWGGNPLKLLLLWKKKKITLISSQELLNEITTVLQRDIFFTKYHVSTEKVKVLVQALELNSVIVKPLVSHKLPLHVRDKKDDIILATAFAGKAEYIITGDKDLLVLNGEKELEGMRILKVESFLQEK